MSADEERTARYRALLSRQLAMNAQTWGVLQARGVSETTELRLDFAYRAPNEAGAIALRDLLSTETDYEVRADSDGGRWSVLGRTQGTSVSLEILDQWVDWMVSAGMQTGCEFDGWGTELRD